MNVPLPVEFRVCLNLFVGFELGKNEFNQVHQRIRSIIFSLEIGPDQKHDQNHVDKVYYKNVDYQKPVLLSGSPVPPVIHQSVNYVV